jgi:zinc ribbon protein
MDLAGLKAPPTSTDAFGMTQTDVGMQSLVEAAPAPGRFACPSCGSMLRVGAILCPHCEADLWTMAHGGPAPSREAQGDAVAETRPAPAPLDGHAGRRSLIAAAAALGAKLLLPLVGTAVEGPSWVWSLLGWGTTLMAVYAIYLARQAGGRIEDTRDGGRPIAATYGLILGMVGLAYVASTFITSSIDRVVGSLHP